MNAFNLLPVQLRNAVNDQIVAPRHQRATRRDGERAFGTGYGNSSGYAAARSYVRPWGTPRFRVG